MILLARYFVIFAVLLISTCVPSAAGIDVRMSHVNQPAIPPSPLWKQLANLMRVLKDFNRRFPVVPDQDQLDFVRNFHETLQDMGGDPMDLAVSTDIVPLRLNRRLLMQATLNNPIALGFAVGIICALWEILVTIQVVKIYQMTLLPFQLMLLALTRSIFVFLILFLSIPGIKNIPLWGIVSISAGYGVVDGLLSWLTYHFLVLRRLQRHRAAHQLRQVELEAARFSLHMDEFERKYLKPVGIDINHQPPEAALNSEDEKDYCLICHEDYDFENGKGPKREYAVCVHGGHLECMHEWHRYQEYLAMFCLQSSFNGSCTSFYSDTGCQSSSKLG